VFGEFVREKRVWRIYGEKEYFREFNEEI